MSNEDNDRRKVHPRVIIDTTDGTIRSITADQPVDIIEVDYTSDRYNEVLSTAKNAEDLRVIPTDLNDPNAVDNGGVFDSYTADVDGDWVNEISEYVNDPHRTSNYARLALEFFNKMEATETE